MFDLLIADSYIVDQSIKIYAICFIADPGVNVATSELKASVVRGEMSGSLLDGDVAVLNERFSVTPQQPLAPRRSVAECFTNF